MKATWIDGAARPVVLELTRAEANKLCDVIEGLADDGPPPDWQEVLDPVHDALSQAMGKVKVKP